MKWQWLCITILVSLKSTLVLSNDLNRLEIMPSGPELRKPINTSTVLLTCRAIVEDADVLEDLRWLYPNGSTIVNEVRKYTEKWPDLQLSLIINNLKREDEGLYKCAAYYSRTQLEASVQLSTYVDITWEDAPLKQHPIANQEGFIKCKVFADPKPDVYWYREGVVYKPGERDRCTIVPDGIKCSPITVDDSGNYSCRARVSRTGSLGDRSIVVEVYTTPKIHPFREKAEAKEDETLVITCKAEGNPKPIYKWYDKGNNEIKDRDRYEVDEIEGTLTIRNLVSEDAGQIACTAKNTAGEARETIDVRVVVKPKITKFDSKSVAEGEIATLHCHVEAEPYANVVFINLSSGVDYTVNTSPPDDASIDRIQVSSDSNTDSEPRETIYTLSIDQLERSDDGPYQCIASNDGGVVKATAHLEVEYIPEFLNSSSNPDHSWLNNAVNISCNTSAIPNASLSWEFNEKEIENRTNIKIFGSGSESTIEINPIDGGYFGNYTCKASNKLGNTRHTFRLKQAFPPGELHQVVFHQRTATTITFRLLGLKDDGGLPVNEYIVKYYLFDHKDAEPDYEERKWRAEISSAATYILDKLKPERTYKFQFAASNAAGIGSWTKEYNLTMPQKAAPEIPEIITDSRDKEVVVSQYPDQYMISWKIPQDNGEKIAGFEVTYYPVKRPAVSNNTHVKKFEKAGDMVIYPIPHPGTTSFLLHGLKPDTYYKIELRANNSIGNSQPGTVFVKTAKDPAYGSIATQDISATSSDTAATGMPLEIIIGIAVAILIIVIVVVDVICFLTNKCGILMFLCVHVCAKHPSNDKVKEAAMEEGKAKDSKDIKKPGENIRHANEDDDVKDATEETPMIDGSKNGKEQEANKNTIESEVNSGKDGTV